jgi:hypothetical protein
MIDQAQGKDEVMSYAGGRERRDGARRGVRLRFEPLEDRFLLSAWSFMVYGDSRGSGSGDAQVGSAILSELGRATVAEQPAFVLFPGDLVNSGDLAAFQLWRNGNASYDNMRPVYEAGIPVYPVLGNHDTPNIEAFKTVFGADLPDNGPAGEIDRTYAVHYKNALILGLDQYAAPHQVNQAWVDQQLAALDPSVTPHVFAFGHEPAFKVNHADNLDDYATQRDAFWNSLAAAGGRAYFSGHDHFYDHAQIDDGDGDPSNDVHQLVVATAGAPLYDTGPYDGQNTDFTPTNVYHEKQYGYLLVTVDGANVSMVWKHRTGPDTFEATAEVFTYTARHEFVSPALFDPAASRFYLRSFNTSGTADYSFAYGQPGGDWQAFEGDWNGDGTSGVGLYAPATSTFYLTNAYTTGVAQYTFGYGQPNAGWIPLVGDWDGDGRDGVGLYDPHTSTFYLTSAFTTGYAEYTFGFGAANAGWTALVGDWNGDSASGVGLYDPHSSTFYLTNSLHTGYAQHTFGYGAPDHGWQPLVGDWNGDAASGVGLFDPHASTFYLTNAFKTGYAENTFGYGQSDAGWQPLVGDWNGDQRAGVGLFAPASSTFYLSNALASGYAQYTIAFGQPGAGWQPLVGSWIAASAPLSVSATPILDSRAVDQINLPDLASVALQPGLESS